MFSSLRKRLTYANVAVTVALVFAMTGGAYAANKFLITSTKQISPKVLKALKGASGKAGAPGAPGAAGPAGPAGAGTAGAKGETGPAGAPGAEGKAGAAGKEGAPGKEGKEGKSGFTKTLPSGETETGTWWFQGTDHQGEGADISVDPISFPIPLSAAVAEHIEIKEWREGGLEPVECPGNTLKPEAEPGVLCIYASHNEEHNTLIGMPFVALPDWSGEELKEGVGPTGVFLYLRELQANLHVGGSFAITAP